MAIKYNSNYLETMPFSDVCVQLMLSANVEQEWTVPGNSEKQYQVYFEYPSNASVFVCKNTAVTVPSGGSPEEQSYNEFKPIKRYVRGGDVLHIVTTDTTTYMGFSLRELQG